jgi:hypothetical protein
MLINDKQVATLPLLYHPGEHWWYSLSFDIAGYLIEKVGYGMLQRQLRVGRVPGTDDLLVPMNLLRSAPLR